MHPTESWLYVLSASVEMKMGNMSGARTMIERGIRMNAKDERLWIEWIKLEMGYIQQLKDKGVQDSNDVLRGGIVEAIIQNAIKGGVFCFCFIFLSKKTKIKISRNGEG
jgi:hypothetical protein